MIQKVGVVGAGPGEVHRLRSVDQVRAQVVVEELASVITVQAQ